MKLRNKKTGEIVENACIGVFKHQSSGDCERIDTEARSLEKVLEEWEDYKPKVPLVGDEDERELVSKWASIYVITKVIARKRKTSPTIELLDFDEKDRILAIDAYTTITDGIYTIEELCGEEEAPEPLEPTLIDLDERIKEKEEE